MSNIVYILIFVLIALLRSIQTEIEWNRKGSIFTGKFWLNNALRDKLRAKLGRLVVWFLEPFLDGYHLAGTGILCLIFLMLFINGVPIDILIICTVLYGIFHSWGYIGWWTKR